MPPVLFSPTHWQLCKTQVKNAPSTNLDDEDSGKCQWQSVPCVEYNSDNFDLRAVLSESSRKHWLLYLSDMSG